MMPYMARWTEDEIEVLRRGVADGKSDAAVAKELERSARAVADKRRALKLVRTGGRKKGSRRSKLTAKERAQRRLAPLKTGEHSTSPPLAAGLLACKSDRCPNPDGHPCSLRREADERGGALELCLPALLEETDYVDAYMRALTDRDDSSLRELTARNLASQEILFERAMTDLVNNGLVVRIPILSDDGETVLGHHRKVDPSAKVVLGTLASNLGHTRAAQGLTAASKAQQVAGEGLLSLSAILAEKAEAGAWGDAGGGA